MRKWWFTQASLRTVFPMWADRFMLLMKMWRMLLKMSHLTGGTMRGEGLDNHSFLGLVLSHADAKTRKVLKDIWRQKTKVNKWVSECFLWDLYFPSNSEYQAGRFYVFLHEDLFAKVEVCSYSSCLGFEMQQQEAWQQLKPESNTWGKMICWISLDNPPHPAVFPLESTVSSHSAMDPWVVWPGVALFLARKNIN